MFSAAVPLFFLCFTKSREVGMHFIWAAGGYWSNGVSANPDSRKLAFTDFLLRKQPSMFMSFTWKTPRVCCGYQASLKMHYITDPHSHLMLTPPDPSKWVITLHHHTLLLPHQSSLVTPLFTTTTPYPNQWLVTTSPSQPTSPKNGLNTTFSVFFYLFLSISSPRLWHSNTR